MTGECQESSQKSWFGARGITFSKGNLKRSSVFWQTYPVLRDPMTVQLTGVGNVSSSALLDLPNVNTNLPPPLLPNPGPDHHQPHQTEVTNLGQVRTVRF